MLMNGMLICLELGLNIRNYVQRAANWELAGLLFFRGRVWCFLLEMYSPGVIEAGMTGAVFGLDFSFVEMTVG